MSDDLKHYENLLHISQIGLDNSIEALKDLKVWMADRVSAGRLAECLKYRSHLQVNARYYKTKINEYEGKIEIIKLGVAL